MSEAKLAEIQGDHKHWFHELERWQYEVGLWAKHHQEIVEEIRRFLNRVEKHGAELQSHLASLEQHQREIAACERCMMEKGEKSARGLAETHAQSKDRHQQLRDAHERLKEAAHTFMAQAAMSRHKPSHRE